MSPLTHDHQGNPIILTTWLSPYTCRGCVFHNGNLCHSLEPQGRQRTNDVIALAGCEGDVIYRRTAEVVLERLK